MLQVSWICTYCWE